jgi:hypothetical protein
MIKDTLDVGATDIKPSKPVMIYVKRGHIQYRLNITKHLEVQFFVDKRWQTLVTYDEIRDLLGYVLRRAIYRGIDTCEITENSICCDINMGSMP